MTIRSAFPARTLSLFIVGATFLVSSAWAEQGGRLAESPSARASASAVEAPPAAAARRPLNKTQTSSARLLLPFFESNFTAIGGIETLFSVRNQDTAPVDIVIHYFEANRPTTPQLVEELSLRPKQVSTHSIRLKNVIRGADGVARGYAFIEADRPVITGDYFRVNDAENFAAGDRLVDADLASAHYSLCRFMTSRAFTGGSFDGGTTFTIFVDSELPLDGSQPVAFYRVYDEPGNLIFPGQLFRDELAFEVKASDLGVLNFEVPNFAVIEFEFNQLLGTVWARMDGNGRVSVGLGANCDDAAPDPG